MLAVDQNVLVRHGGFLLPPGYRKRTACDRSARPGTAPDVEKSAPMDAERSSAAPRGALGPHGWRRRRARRAPCFPTELQLEGWKRRGVARRSGAGFALRIAAAGVRRAWRVGCRKGGAVPFMLTVARRHSYSPAVLSSPARRPGAGRSQKGEVPDECDDRRCSGRDVGRRSVRPAVGSDRDRRRWRREHRLPRRPRRAGELPSREPRSRCAASTAIRLRRRRRRSTASAPSSVVRSAPTAPSIRRCTLDGVRVDHRRARPRQRRSQVRPRLPGAAGRASTAEIDRADHRSRRVHHADERFTCASTGRSASRCRQGRKKLKLSARCRSCIDGRSYNDSDTLRLTCVPATERTAATRRALFSGTFDRIQKPGLQPELRGQRLPRLADA